MFLIPILHQTTTYTEEKISKTSLFLIPILHQTTTGNAWVYGNAQVESQTDWLLVGPAKSSGRFTTAYRDTKIGVRVSCGCFTGTAQEFSAQIEATHAGNQQHLQQYRLFCQLIAFSFDIQPA